MDVPGWVGPTVAISLVVIAVGTTLLAGIMVALFVGARRQALALRAAVQSFATDARAMTARLRGELEGYVALSGEARAKLRGAMRTVDGRLRDLDALVEVLQEEAEETALDAASFLRTLRRTGSILGAARRRLRRARR
jgi:hypothetical protein